MNWKPISETPTHDGLYVVWTTHGEWAVCKWLGGAWSHHGITHWQEISAPTEEDLRAYHALCPN